MTHKKTTPVSSRIDMVSSYDHGRYYVHTRNSVYRLDLEEETLARFPAAPEAEPLRADCEPIHLARIVRCAVGYPGVFVLTGLTSDDMETLRSTTCVERIELIA